MLVRVEVPPPTKISPRGLRRATVRLVETPTNAGPRFFFFTIVVRRDGSAAAIKRFLLRITTTSVRDPPPRTKVRLPPPTPTLMDVRERVRSPPRLSRPPVLSVR